MPPIYEHPSGTSIRFDTPSRNVPEPKHECCEVARTFIYAKKGSWFLESGVSVPPDYLISHCPFCGAKLHTRREEQRPEGT